MNLFISYFHILYFLSVIYFPQRLWICLRRKAYNSSKNLWSYFFSSPIFLKYIFLNFLLIEHDCVFFVGTIVFRTFTFVVYVFFCQDLVIISFLNSFVACAWLFPWINFVFRGACLFMISSRFLFNFAKLLSLVEIILSISLKIKFWIISIYDFLWWWFIKFYFHHGIDHQMMVATIRFVHICK